MNAEHLIQTATDLANRMYADAHPADRLAFHVGLLESRLREICYLYENTAEELRNVQRQLLNFED